MIKKGYVCGVDWQHELGAASVTVYPSKESCEKHSKCTDECGIVEIEIKLNKWVKPYNDTI